MMNNRRAGIKIDPSTIGADYYVLKFWRSAEAGMLTERQRLWCEEWESLEEPTAAEVARKLCITKQASGKIKKRIIAVLLHLAEKHFLEKQNDEILDAAAFRKEEWLSERPRYLEYSENGGKRKWVLWEANSKPRFDERLGREVRSGYGCREVSEDEAAALRARGVPARRRLKAHKASPLARWWLQKTQEFAAVEGLKYSEARRALYRQYSVAGRCRQCQSYLPYGETIPGSGMGRVTERREFCSNFCKVLHKRLRKK
jgi:hypothetical protein